MTLAVFPAQAEVNAAAPVAEKPALSREALKKLGQQFANQIGGRLQEADLYLQGAGKLELAEHKARTKIPDDEPLIMRAAVGEKRLSPGSSDIYAVKRNKKFFVSLGDFATATDLAISVSPGKGTADGWFIREDQRFHLDVEKKQATIMGQASAIDPADVLIEDDMILVSTAQMEKWFGFSFDYDFGALVLVVSTTQPLPVETAYQRRLRGGGGTYTEAKARLPEQKVPYAMLTQPYFDTNISGTWQRTPESEPVRTGAWSTVMNNDFAGFNAQVSANGPMDREYPVSSARVSLGKQDAEGNLLGPLKATNYRFGDITPVSIPLITGNSGVEQGIIVSNQPIGRTTQTNTQVNGNAQPGWDVELYRNNIYIATQRVDATGYYDFPSVDLALGGNDIKLLFYGPRGEVREEQRRIDVDPGLLAGSAGYYSLSATRNKVLTWQPDPPSGDDVGDVNLAALYQHGLAANTTLDLGVRRHSDSGEQRTFAHTGLATYLQGAYINAQVGVDAQTSASTASLTARRNLGDHSAMLQYTWTAEEYNTGSSDGTSAARDSYRAALNGPLPGRLAGFGRFNYSLSGGLNNNYDGSQQQTAGATLSTRVAALGLSGGANYSRTIGADGETTETGSGNLNASGFAFGGNWRVGTQYNLLPTAQLTEANFDYSRPVTERMDASANVRHRPETSYTDTSFALNWRTPKATISPTVALDTSDNLRAGVNVHFGSAANPYSHKYTMYNAYMSGSGGVAARVFQDKNGNGIYDGNDTLMPDVIVKALQVHRRATTDKNGVAFLADIQQGMLTDIVVDNSSLEDPYGMSLFEGVSLRTHPGSMTKLDFPIVTGGELDGQTEMMAADGTRKTPSGLKISLIAPDGKVEKSVPVASDGYYAISAVRPGVYYLTAERNDDSETAGAFLPRLVEFKPEGTTLFGQGVTLNEGYNTRFTFTSENPAPVGEKRARVVRLDDLDSQKIYIRLGEYHSRLAMTFAWYKFKIRSTWGDYLAPVTPIANIKPDPKTQLMTIELAARKPMSIRAAADICQRLKEEKFQCSVKVVTKYRNSAPVASETARTKSRG